MNKALAKAIIDSGQAKKVVARRLKLSPSAFSMILHGDREPTSQQRAKLAAILKRSEAELFDQVSA